MHHGIAVISGHHHHLIGGEHDLELTNLEQTAGLSWTLANRCSSAAFFSWKTVPAFVEL